MIWIIDVAHRTIMGLEAAFGFPNPAAIRAALRSAILRDNPQGPAGGLPRTVSIDNGRNLLLPVCDALGEYGIDVQLRRSSSPSEKGAAESVHTATTRALADADPDTRHPIMTDLQPRQRLAKEVWTLAGEWNRRPRPHLGGLSPLQAWLQDPQPVNDVPQDDPLLYLMYDNDDQHRVRHAGITFNGRRYTGPALINREGDLLRVKWATTDRDTRVEVCELDGRYLGPVFARA